MNADLRGEGAATPGILLGQPVLFCPAALPTSERNLRNLCNLRIFTSSSRSRSNDVFRSIALPTSLHHLHTSAVRVFIRVHSRLSFVSIRG
jgi:hypothetical protein